MPSPPPLSAILAKVNALMDKALSTHSEEEARTCALTGVKLLRQYELRLVGKDDGVTPPLIDRLEKKRYEDLVRQAKLKIEAAEARAKLAEEALAMVKARASQENAEVERAKDLAGRWIRARHSGNCRRCGDRCDKWAKIWWLGTGKGFLCVDCQWRRSTQRQRTGS